MGLFDHLVPKPGQPAAPESPLAQPPALTRANLFAAHVPEPSFTGAMAKGFKRSLPETKSLLAGAGAAAAGAVGLDGVRDKLLDTYQGIQQNEVAPLQAKTGFIDAVTGDGSLKEWAGDTLGNFGGQALQSVAAAGAGALVGSAVPGAGTVAGGVGGLLFKAGAKEMVTDAVGRMVAKGVAKDVAEQTALRRLGGAAVAGTGLNVGQEIGTGYTGRAEDAKQSGEQLTQTDALRAIGYGIPAGLVDTAAEALTGSRLMRGVSDSPKILSRMAKGAGIGAVSEGGTEGVQAVLERAGANQALTGDAAYRDYIENIAAGALGGGVAGAGGGFRRQQDPAAPPPPETPPPPMTPEVNASQAVPPAPSPLATPPVDVASDTAQTPPPAVAPPLIADTAGQAVAAPPAADPVFEQAKQLLGEAGKVQRGKLAEKLGLNRNQMKTLLDQLHAAGIIGPPNGKKARKLLINPVTGDVLDPDEKARLDRKVQRDAEQKALEEAVRGGKPAAAIEAAAAAQGQQPEAAQTPSPLSRPPMTPEFEAKMRERQAAALTRAQRPDPATGATSKAAAVAFDTGAAAAAEQQAAQAAQDQQAQAAVTAQAEADKAQQQQQKMAEKAAKEADKAARQAEKDRVQAEKTAQAAALQTTDEDIRVAVQAEIDAGKPMDGMRMSALAAKLKVTPKRIDEMRMALAQAKKRGGAAPVIAQSTTADQPQTAGTQVGSTPLQAGSSQTPASAALETPVAAATQPSAAAYDDSADVLDDDITPPSGGAFSIRSAAESTAKRTPGGKVFEVDGGFVVRVPRAVVNESLTTAPDPGLEDALRQERDAYTNERDDAYLNKTKHARDPLKDAVEDAVNASVLDPDAARVVLDVALSNGRVDLAEYAVSRAERAVAGMSVTPGVPQNSPKYADIKAALESRKREATALLDSLKKDLAAAKTATVKESLTVAAAKPKEAIATDVAGEQLDDKWTAFAPETGTLNVPRADMPQVKSEHRGAMVQYLAARGITHEQAEVPADSLKPTQAEFSAGKVKKALKRAAEGEDRAILVSADGHVLDGHHQWLAKREAGAPVKVIRLNAPIAELLQQVKEFPSSTTAGGATASQTQQEPTNAEQTQRTEQAPASGQAAEAAKAAAAAPAKPEAPLTVGDQATAAIPAAKRRLREARNRGDAKAEAEIERELRQLRAKVWDESPLPKPEDAPAPAQQALQESEWDQIVSTHKLRLQQEHGIASRTAGNPVSWQYMKEPQRAKLAADVRAIIANGGIDPQVDGTPAPAKPEKGIVGRRADGVMIREDERGVRWYAQGGVRIFETVSMRPTRQGMQIDRGVLQREFMTAEESAAAAKDAAPTEQPKAKPAPSANTIVTDADAEAARARLKAKFTRLNSGIDPEMMLDGITLGMYHIERGARTFAAYAKAMVEDLGDAVKPYLKSWYMGVKYDPRAAGFDGMDSAASVENAVVDSTPAPAQDSVTEDSPNAAPDQPSPQALDSTPAEESGGTAPAGETGVSPPGGSQTGVRSDSGAATVRVPSARGGRGGTVGVSDSQAGATGGGRRGSRRTARAGAGVSEDDAGLTGEQTPETAQPPNIPAINFKIGDDTGLGKGGEVAKFKDNVEAIRTLKLIESERRRATPDEQRALARWVGWGGLASAFPNPETGKFKDGWEQRGNDLRDMLTPSEYRAARRSTRNAHFTSEVVVNFMWDAVRRLGYRNGLALESSMGSGNFVGLMPDDLAARFIGVEYDSITARLAGALYPQATVLHSGFQDVPLPDGTFDLNIGNPPFGSESLRFQFKPELRGLSIHNQFFLASLDALKAGGLQVQVVSSFLMDAQDKTARQKLADKADLVAAFRLPDTAFKENARTEVVTDILILRKRASPLPRDKDNKGKELPPDYPAWVNTDTVPDPLGGEPIPVNTYFKANPDHIIGTMDRSGKMRAAGMMNVHLDDPSTLGARLNALLAKVPQNVVNTAADVAERTEQAYTLLGEAMRISVAREEPGHMAFSADGKLTRVIEREHGEGTLLQRQEITADSPWSAQLFQDSDGRWYKVEVQTDEEGKAVKVADAAGAATRFNAYTRKVYATEADIPSTLRLGKLGFERMTQLVNLRDLLKNQLVLETEDATKVKMEANRAKLAAAYKAYVDQHGPVNRRATAALVSEMPDGGLLLALESSYEPERTAEQAKRSGLPKQSEMAKPAAILSERVVPKYEPVTKAETPSDALAITLAERGVVDIEHIAKLLGQSPEDAATALTEGDKPLVFKDPELDTYETADAYLSGQVTRKLMAAQAAGLTQNAKALQAVQPERWGAENVSVQVGAAWVPPTVYADFATHLMGGSATASFSPITNTFTVAVKGTDKAKADQWGTDHMTGIDILSRLLNSQTPSVTYRDSEGKTHVDKEATTLAILKGREIVSEFGDWIFKDGARREQLVDIFNQKFNTRVSRQYDGQHLKLPGKVPDAMIQMRRHQKNAIWRGISSKFLLIDHVVGAGKTFTAIARAMERRRMGLAQKPTIVVPNHLVEQWQADVYRLYPGAKVLAATKKDFEKKNRRRLLSRVATGDYDIVILPHSSFGFVGISPETELRYLDEDLQQAIQAVKDAQAQAEEDGDVGHRKPLGVKEAERLVTKIQERMDKLREGARDRLLTFEQLGIDDLTIDEAHEFKNLFYSSRLTKVRGMGDKVGSRKAADLYHKVRVVRDSAGSVVFMTGTPVSNSVVELYTMMRYLAAPELKELGMEHFDAWRSQFVDATPAFEPNESGRLQEVTRLGRSWSNMRSLMDLYYSFTDAVTIDDIKQWYAEDNDGKAFPVPNVKGGDRQLRKVMPTPAQESVLAEVIAGFDGLDGIRDQQERNAARLRLMDRARKLSLDVRAVDPRAQSKEEGGKLELLSAEVKRIYDRWTPDRGTQLVFLDRSVPKAKGDDKIIKEYDTIVARRDKALKDDDEVAFQEANEALERYDADEIRELRSAQAGGWNAYQQIKDNLVALGIPAAEIRFVQEANTDEQKQALFDAVNGGKVRVLIGSTPRMGAGTNVQKRLVALHHADVTWKPSDIEQREGRIIRQGNDLLAKHGENFEVEILAYATERTVDAKMWSLNATKLRAINGLRKYTGDFTMEVEDSESVSMAEMAALASGNPLLLERVTLESEIANLELQEKAHRRKRFGIEDALERAQRIVAGHPARIEQARTQTAVMGNKVESLRTKAAKRNVVVEGKTYTDAKSAMKAALDAVERQQDGNEKARYGITINGERVTSKDAIDTAIGQAIGDHETFEVQINGATYTQRTAGGRAAAEIISPRAADALEQPVSGKLGSMMGMDLLYQIKEFKAGRFWTGGRRVNIEVWLEDAGQTVASVDIDGHDPLIKLNTVTMRDALGKLASRVESAADTDNVTRLESELARAKREVPELAPKLKEPFAKAQEITDKRARLNEVVGILSAAPPVAPAQPAADVGSTPAPARTVVSGRPYFRNFGGDVVHEPNAKKIELSEMPDGEFYIAPGVGRDSGKFEIMEATTGLRVGLGKTRKAAIEAANKAIVENRATITTALEQRAFPKDKLDAAIAKLNGGNLASFAKSGEPSADVYAAWRALVNTTGAMQFKTSAAKDFRTLVKEIAPELKILDESADFLMLEVPPQMDKEGRPKGQPKDVFIGIEGNRVFVDVEALEEGVHRGSSVYSVALAYAHNNGKLFVPDPRAVKPIAMIRRTEHMLSSALRYGTTAHMLPHPKQNLDWRPGNHVHNTIALLNASAQNVLGNVPELANVDYDWESGRFVRGADPDALAAGKGGGGQAFDRNALEALAKSAGARAAGAGFSTLRRALVHRSLARRASKGGWGAVVARLLQLRSTGVLSADLDGIAYARGADGARGMPADKLTRLLATAKQAMALLGVNIEVVANGSDLPAEITGQDDYDDTVQAAITGDRKTVYFVASRIASPRAAMKLVAHELVGHMSMEQLLGKRWPELRDAILRLRDNGKWPEVFAEVSKRYERNADGTFRALDDATFAAEAIAVFAERNIQTSILQRAVNAVRAWLRRLGFAMDMSQGELRQMLWEAGQKLEGRAYRPGVVDDVLGAKPEQMSMREAVERYSFSRIMDRQPFYSALLRSIEEGRGAPKKADGTTWRQWLDGAQRRGEIKQSEREWVGVDAWLDGRAQTTRAELADYLKANQVQVKEVVLSGDGRDAAGESAYQEFLREMVAKYGPDWEFEATEDEVARREVLLSRATTPPAKFGSYQLPGGQNYRELLLTMPDASVETDSTGRFRVRFFDETGRDRVEHATMPQVEAFRRRGNRAEVLGPVVYKNASKNYTSSHFDQPNILAHVRFNERTDADGKRVLFVEEVQSDWHQEGRKKGYGGQQSAQRREQIQSRMAVLAEALEDSLPDDGPKDRAEYDRLAEELRALPGAGAVPDAPLKKEWPLTAMKRMLRYAAENGFDRLAWTTGDQQAERYDLSKQVDRITVNGRTNAATGEKSRAVNIDLANMGGAITLGVNKDGIVDNQRAGSGDFVGKPLADVIGKEMADRIMSAELGLGGKEFSGDGLKLGGQGMRAFYDKMLPAELAKYVKRWGGKVGTTELEFSNADPRWAKKNGSLALGQQPSIDITPAMRQAAMEGQPLFAKAGTIVDRLQEAINPKDTTLLQRLKDKLSDWRPAALGALQLRHLGELAERILPPVAMYSGVVQRMATMRNELQELGHKVVEAGMQYQGKNPEESKRLFKLLHDATLAGVDPSGDHKPLMMMAADYRTNVAVTDESVRAFVKLMREQAKLNPGSAVSYVNRVKEARKLLSQERKRRVSHKELAPKFATMSADGKALWAQMRDAYKTQTDEYEKALISRIQSLNFDKAKKAGQIARMRLTFESARVPFYVPLARWGQFWVSGTNSQGQREFFMQESQGDQRRVIKELEKSGYLDIGHGVKLDTVKAQDGASASFMADMDEMLTESGAPEKIRDEAFQLYLRSLPDLSMRKNFIHRQGTPGYSQDALRALAGHIFHGSFQIARLRYAHELEGLRTEAEDMAKDMGKAGDPDANAAGNIVNELKKRHEWVMNPQDNAIINKISSIGFVYYLGLTPAAALVNLLQTPMVALPILAGKHKLGAATRELMRAMKESMSTYGHMQTKLEGDELEAHKEFARRGVFDKTQAHNMAGISESDTHAYSPTWHKMMTVISHVFHKAEVVNRESTAMAAYRLERAAGAGHIEAVEAADRAVHESQFDYSNANRARFMQSGTAKVLLMFRQYSLAVTWLLGRNMYQAFKGEDAATKREAKRKLAGILGMTAIFSGTLGLPIIGTVGAVLNAVAAAVGDDDEPWDWETEFRAFLREMLGETGAEAVLRGPVQAATGVGIANRVSMGDLWFREPDRELEGRAWSNYLFEQAAGPMGGLITNFFRAQQLMGEGHVWRGVETMMPKAIKDAMKSVRYLDEGVNNMRGDPIVEDLNVFESLAQVAGFAPASVANAYDTARDVKNYEQAILNRRSRLMDAFALAWRLGDIEAREAVIGKMRKFSQTYPELAITSDSIRRSLMQRAKASAQADNGVIVDKRIRARLEAQLGMAP